VIFEWRSYDLLPGKVPAYLGLLQTVGLGIVTRHLSMLGYWVTESGTLNRLHHLWLYRDLDDRACRRIELAADKIWTGEFIPAAMPLVLHQHNSFMLLDEADQSFRDLCNNALGLPPAVSDAGDSTRSLCQFAYTSERLPVDESTLVRWRVLSGYRVGAFATLTRGGPLRENTTALIEHEVMRPLAFSPLN
jgi:NIPSNAP